MTINKRIILNVLTTFGRSMLSFVCTLFTARWILSALGQVDFGLYGVVGSIMFFVGVFNVTQTATVSRFYAYAIGHQSQLKDVPPNGNPNSELNVLFNSALSIHLLLVLITVPLGYLVGTYALEHWLNIPLDRLCACKWVLGLSLFAFSLSTVSVPYSALLIAYQLIAIQVLFSLVQVFGTVIVAYYMLHCSGDRLIVYAALMLSLGLLVVLIQVQYVRRHFPSFCRIKLSSLFKLKDMRGMLKFSFYGAIGTAAWGVRSYGGAFLVNIFFGAIANAAYSIGNQLSGQATTLSSTLASSFSPALTTEEGAGHRETMRLMALRCCKFGSILLLMIAVPLVVVMDDWLYVWLKTPPAGSAILCACFLLSNIIAYLTAGQSLALRAHGNIYKWQIYDAICFVFSIVVALIFVAFGVGIVSIGIGYIVTAIMSAAGNMFFARKLVGLGYRRWFGCVLWPLCLSSGIAYILTWVVSREIAAQLPRLFTTSFVGAASVVGLAYFIALDAHERAYIVNRVKNRLRMIRV